jgi:putative FmdB family regulatory protein
MQYSHLRRIKGGIQDTMPAYDYRCEDCGAPFEVRMSIAEYSEGVHPACKVCGSTRVERTFGSVNVLTGGRSGGGIDGSCGPGAFT